MNACDRNRTAHLPGGKVDAVGVLGESQLRKEACRDTWTESSTEWFWSEGCDKGPEVG